MWLGPPRRWSRRLADSTARSGLNLDRFNAGGGVDRPCESAGGIGTIIGRAEGLAIDVIANSVGSVRVTGGLSGNSVGWNVTNGIGSLTAGVIGDLNLQAGFLGPVIVTGNLALLGFGGRYQLLVVHTDRQRGTLGEFGLKS